MRVFIHRRNSSVNFSNDVHLSRVHGLLILTQSIATSINRRHRRPELQSACLTTAITATVMTGVALIPPERSSMSPFCHRITPFTVGSPFVDQSEGTIQATVVVWLLNYVSLQRNIRKMVTVQIWMNYVCRFVEMNSHDLMQSSRDCSKVKYAILQTGHIRYLSNFWMILNLNNFWFPDTRRTF